MPRVLSFLYIIEKKNEKKEIRVWCVFIFLSMYLSFFVILDAFERRLGLCVCLFVSFICTYVGAHVCLYS